MSWVVAALLSAFFAALVAIFGKIGLEKVDTTLATTLRALVMAGFFVVVSTALGKFSLFSAVHGRAWLFIVLSGLAGALSWLTYFFALKTGPASAVAALDRLSVVFVVVLAIIFLGEKLDLRTAVAALLLTAGAVLLVR
jgi:transporter family protein